MIWHFGDTPETPCFGAPSLFFAATDCSLLTYDRAAPSIAGSGSRQSSGLPEFLQIRLPENQG
jgi:hypothetical protein